MSHAYRSSFFQRFWKPTAVTAAGGMTVAFWFEEIILYIEIILALIFLPIMAGVIYLLNMLIFKSRMLKREDLINPNETGEKL
jgi:phosphate/sulfate permease